MPSTREMGARMETGLGIGRGRVLTEKGELGLPHVSRFVREGDPACRKGKGYQDAFGWALRVKHLALCSLVDGFPSIPSPACPPLLA